MNRSLAVKFDRAKSQRINAGMVEGTKSAYRGESKASLRAVAAAAQHMVKKVIPKTIEPEKPNMVDYRRSVTRKVIPWQNCIVDCGPELIKRRVAGR